MLADITIIADKEVEIEEYSSVQSKITLKNVDLADLVEAIGIETIVGMLGEDALLLHMQVGNLDDDIN